MNRRAKNFDGDVPCLMPREFGGLGWVGPALSYVARAFHLRPNRPDRTIPRKVMFARPPSMVLRMPEPLYPLATILFVYGLWHTAADLAIAILQGPVAHM